MMSLCLESVEMPMSVGTRALFKWKGKSCPDSEANSCWLGQCDILVMDGQCQDESLHCTNPGLDQERINVTFLWIQRYTASCPLRTGVVCCCYEDCRGWRFLGFLGAPWGLVHVGGAGVASFTPSYLQDSGSPRCAYRWTRPPVGWRSAGALSA